MVTKHLPGDRISISPGNVVTVRKKKRDSGELGWGWGRRDRYGRGRTHSWEVRAVEIKWRQGVVERLRRDEGDRCNRG